MTESKRYIQKLFSGNNIVVPSVRDKMFEEFVSSDENISVVKQIIEIQNKIMRNWKLSSRIKDIIEQPVRIPNGKVGKDYEAKIDFLQLGWNDIVFSQFENLEQYGLSYDNETEKLYGIPLLSGDFKIELKFRVEGEAEDSVLNIKQIPLIINADPKSLWNDLPSNKEDVFWKEDNVNAFQPLGSKHIVVASKRGRSHANVGSFRDDDYAFKYFEDTGWSVVAVSDGAGSSKVSRKGSQIACQTVINYFEEKFSYDLSAEMDELARAYHDETRKNDIESADVKNGTPEGPEPAGENTESTSEIVGSHPDVAAAASINQKIGIFIYNNLGNAARTVHKKLEEFARENQLTLKDLHSTLIFALYKKYESGYVVLSFGVGDCPIGLLNKDITELKLMNWLDVGEFGGGTRFITMPEIFQSPDFSTRFGFKYLPDFSYLMLMTDGIYDPKFVVEANLEKLESWKAFLDDLQGNNEEKIQVEFNEKNAHVADQLSSWMDFWSPGNHDDRTLAIVF